MAKSKNGEIDHEDNVMAGTSGDRVESATGTNEVNLEETRRVKDERLEKLSEANREGHEKNMKKIEEMHAGDKGQKPAPQLGREDNGNTPRIDKDGNKTWYPPGVAGARRA